MKEIDPSLVYYDGQVSPDQKYDYRIEVLDANGDVLGSTTIRGWTKPKGEVLVIP